MVISNQGKRNWSMPGSGWGAISDGTAPAGLPEKVASEGGRASD